MGLGGQVLGGLNSPQHPAHAQDRKETLGTDRDCRAVSCAGGDSVKARQGHHHRE